MKVFVLKSQSHQKKIVFVIDDQDCYRENCRLKFEDQFLIHCAENIDEFEEKFSDQIKNASAIIIDNCLGRESALSSGFADRVRTKYAFRGKLILFSVMAEFLKEESNQLKINKFDAIWDKQTDITLDNLNKVMCVPDLI